MMESTLTKYQRNMKVYIQVLPPQNSSWDYVKPSDDNKTIFVRCSQDLSKRANVISPCFWKFETDGLLNSMKQEDIFNTYIKPSLKYSLMGVDLLIFAYGQTGSGKSTTINGLLNNFDNRGITPRIISEMFALKDEVKYESKIKFQISFVEIFKNYIIDLINYQNGYKIRTPFKNIHMQKIESESEGWKFLFQGEGRRRLEKIDKYFSNIATSIYTIFVKNVSKVFSNPVEKHAKIHIIDMSGIDTCGNISCQLKNVLDVGSANLNKTILERCILIIQEEIIKEKTSIKDPAPLIAYLGKSLTAHSLSIFLGHIRSNREDVRITLSALKFASKIKKIKVAKLKATVVTSVPLSIKNLQNKLNTLQEQMYLNSMLKNSDLSFNLTQNRVEQIQHAINEYINDKTNEISVLNVTDAVIALNVFKEICCKLEAEKLAALEKMQAFNSKTQVTVGTLSTRLQENKPSTKSRRSIDKRRPSEEASKASKQSYRQSSISNTTKETNLSKTGITLGHLLASNYQGDASKSLLMKSTKNSPAQMNDLSTRSSDQIYCTLSDFKLNDFETNNIDIIWMSYKKDLNYNFEKFNDVLKMLLENSKDLLNNYNDLIDELNKKIEVIDFKKYDLLKITLYQGMASLQCSAGEDEGKQLNETKERLSNSILELMKDSIEIKEEILTLLADLKIMVQEYHRKKKEMNQDFAEYCINTFHVRIPCSDQILESIEDDLAVLDAKTEEISDISNPNRDLFIKYQNTLKRNRLVNNNLI